MIGGKILLNPKDIIDAGYLKPIKTLKKLKNLYLTSQYNGDDNGDV